MPELPEVDTARRTLEPLVVGRRIERLEVLRAACLRTHAPAEASRILAGRRIQAIGRRGKALVFSLDGGWVLTFHFALWGVVRVRDALAGAAPSGDAATSALLHLEGGRAVEFRELQLSGLHLYREAELKRTPFFAEMGPDALAPGLTLRQFRERLRGRGTIRSLLTDQSRLAGIGNMWSQEILFAAGLRPSRAAQTLDAAAWSRLYRATRTVLRRAVRAGGEPEFPDATGRLGRFALAVYKRAGQPCRVCGTTIAQGRVGGRPAFYCPTCQR
ncbi:MAG: DNA-formamidopyrimidine glycosylase family protein [Armatimonadota bacterium]|nr:DNA-formamidopyrimidine glycosylase family protein [Armatimonadota bacterium]